MPLAHRLMRLYVSVQDSYSCRLRVYDDGIGYEPGAPRTTGLQLVSAFAKGLRGCFDLRSECGTVAELRFPLGN
jgi:two-component sensor histidine kinase